MEQVFGKAGRAETATDPAPFSMRWKQHGASLENPRREWRSGMTKKICLSTVSMKWTRALVLSGASDERLDAMLDQKSHRYASSTGIRTPVGIKILGADLTTIEKIGTQLEGIIKNVPGTRSVFAERTAGGYFLDFNLRRDQLARYGLSVKDAEEIIMSAIGGEPVTTTVEGRERYTVSVRYARELRDNLPKLRRVLVPTMSGAQIPLSELADIELKLGPSMIRDENGLLAGYVYVDIAGRDIGRYVEDAKQAAREKLALPEGYSLLWSGQVAENTCCACEIACKGCSSH